MSLWLITGLSGAGKATALHGLERAGVMCIDNLPVDLVHQLAGRDRTTAAVIDARQADHLEVLPALGAQVTVVFLDARDDVLVRRLGETTRPHPFESRGRGAAAVEAERDALQTLRAAADVVLDTSDLSARELQQRVVTLVTDGAAPSTGLRLTVSSFGYKHGVPLDADWIVDVRMMRNPFWVPALRSLTGLDAPVRDFVMAEPESEPLVDRVSTLLAWTSQHYAEHGRRFLHVALGCTGGRHRSVVLSESLAAALRGQGLDVQVRHRDVRRPDPRDAAPAGGRSNAGASVSRSATAGAEG